MNDYQIVSLVCFAALFLLVFVPIWIGKAIGRGREMPAPPPRPRHDDPCSVLHCDQPATKGIHGWQLCAGHHAAISGRAPYNQEWTA